MKEGSDHLGWNGTTDTVESALNLDILDLQKKGFLALAAGLPWQIEWSSNGKPRRVAANASFLISEPGVTHGTG
jgi:hypothetical protein